MPSISRKLPFSYLMMAILFVIIATVVLAGIWTNYETSRSHLEANADGLRAITESHINTSFRMIDTSLKIYDSTYNEEMKDAFVLVMAEYNRTGGDPSRMDLDGLKNRNGGLDVYVINDRLRHRVYHKARRPRARLHRNLPRLRRLPQGRSGTPRGSTPTGSSRTGRPRRMTKFGYMPTPDHRYVIELGLSSEVFEERADGRSIMTRSWRRSASPTRTSMTCSCSRHRSGLSTTPHTS